MGKFNCPVMGARLTSAFGWRVLNGQRQWHQGIDLASPVAGKKVPVYASAEGTVTRVQLLGTYGKVVMILHNINGKTMETNYAHLDSTCVRVGQKVKQGEKIGVMGNTGGSFGVHLHFEIHQGRWTTGQPNAIDPMKWIELNTCKPLGSTPVKPAEPAKKDYSKQLGYNAPKDTSKAFRIHTSAYANKVEAEKAERDLVLKGYLRYAEIFGNNKDGYRVKSGKYNSQKEAEQVAIKMLDAKVINYASIIGTPQ